MSETVFKSNIQLLKDYECADIWQAIQAFFGKEIADELDFSSNFNFNEVYQRGDVKECEAFYYIAAIQKHAITMTFNVNHPNVIGTCVQLELWAYKLSDKAQGREHLWLH